MNEFALNECACFGVAGNFTGHLEQAGEAGDFKAVKTESALSPKAVFPTYLPNTEPGQKEGKTPQFLHVFPFDSEKIIFPGGEEKIQIEAECAILFKAVWNKEEISSLTPLSFCASNDVSIRKQGARKISEKKNWGKSSKGSGNMIAFTGRPAPGKAGGKNELSCIWETLDRYRISSYLFRSGRLYEYGENSAVRSYSYFYEKLIAWLLDRLNFQKDEGPVEDIHSYLLESGRPEFLFVSVGATRYTEFGLNNFLASGDGGIVCLYPEDRYSKTQIEEMIVSGARREDVSILAQKVIL